MIYLASKSPQRCRLLQIAGVPYVPVDTTGDEAAVTVPQPQLLALDRARVKAEGAVLPDGASGAILGADTVVALGGRVFGKPVDDADARRMLGELQGTTHAVFTGHHLIRVVDGHRGIAASGLSIANVTMRRMSEAEISAYVATGEHRGRAGSYAIQETGDRFVVDLQGSVGTVTGLSVSTVAKLWRELTNEALAAVDERSSRQLPSLR